jgi:hypothetical protein
MQERQLSCLGDELCPVLFSIYGGWMNVMPRCQGAGEWSLAMSSICNKHGFIERKECSFGLLNNRLVAVDYG